MRDHAHILVSLNHHNRFFVQLKKERGVKMPELPYRRISLRQLALNKENVLRINDVDIRLRSPDSVDINKVEPLSDMNSSSEFLLSFPSPQESSNLSLISQARLSRR